MKNTRKVPKKESRSAPNRAKINQPTANAQSTVHLSRAASDYARCLSNPFTGPQAGIPTYPTVHSLKQRSWIKGTFSTSETTGFGFVILCPECGSFSNTAGIIASNSTYTLSATPVATSDPDIQTVTSNSQFNSSSVGSSSNELQYRVVSSGLRVRYIGSELNRGGQKLAFVDPTHTSIRSETFARVNNERSSVRFPVDRKWTTVLYRPVSSGEIQYRTELPPSTGDGRIGYMSFLVQAASSTTPLSYEFEAYIVTEFQGSNVRGMSPTHHDPIGFAAMDHISQSSNHLTPNQFTGEEREGKTIAAMTNYVHQGVSHVGGPSRGGHQIASAQQHQSGGSFWEHLSSSLGALATPLVTSLLPALL